MRSQRTRFRRLATFRAALVVLAMAPACAQDEYVGPRFRAEREMWRINQEFRRLSIKPELVETETWRALAERYEKLSADFEYVHATEASAPADQARTELRGLVARAWVNAAQVHAMIGDSLQMAENYERVTKEFQDLPLVVSEVALAQGQLAENQREWEKAAAAYQGIVDRVQPQPGEPGVAGAVLKLPLRIARLRVAAAAATKTQSAEQIENPALAASSPNYDEARRRYGDWIRAHPGTRLEVESRLCLAELAADQSRWDAALSEVHAVEKQVKAMDDPPTEPGGLRFTTAMLQSRASAPPDSIRKTLRSIPQEYPQSPSAPQALLALSRQAATLGAMDDALEYLDQLRDDYPQWASPAAQGMLLRAQILEKDGRWFDAYNVLRALPVQYPMSEEALQAPLEIVAHYLRSEDQDEVDSALKRAEQEYREFIERYPKQPETLFARTKLVQTLLLQKRFDDAIGELLGISDAMQENPRAANFMLEAARVAQQNLGNSERAAEILEQIGVKFPKMQIGQWASSEAARLRGVPGE